MKNFLANLVSAGSVLALVSSIGTGVSRAQATEFINISGGPAAGTYYTVVAGMARLIEKNIPNVKATARTASGTLENTHLLGNKRVEFALAAAFGPYAAVRGAPPFEGKKYTNLRYVATGYASVFQMIVRKNSDINSIADFKGKRIGVLAGITGQNWYPRIAEVYGVKGQHKTFLLSVQGLTTSYRDNNIDAVVYCGSQPDASIMDMVTAKPSRFLPISSDKAKEIFETHGFFFETPVVKGKYPGVDEDAPSLGSPNLLLSRAGVSEDLVYKITKLFMENNDALKAIHPNARLFNLENAGKSAVIQVHPGARRYYEEAGVADQLP